MSGRLAPAQQALKGASLALYRAAGGAEAAAEVARIGKSQIAAAGSVNCPDVWLPLDVIADLEAVTCNLPGWPHVTRALARRTGHALVPLPEVREGLPHIGPAELAALAKEAGEAISSFGRTVANGGFVDASEVHGLRLVSELDQLIDVAVRLRAACEIITGEGSL